MGKEQELSIVLLLCMQTALALMCRECKSYSHQKCIHEMRTCTAKDGESCLTVRLWISPSSVHTPNDAYSRCQENCTTDEYYYGDYTILIKCCKKFDFCNDIAVPSDEWS
uniref:UPAR/Ly6 domain-containing protein n=1 Tax=Mus spicilegus TaxID=10103 RepID=A0A8C6HA87_MUSSI